MIITTIVILVLVIGIYHGFKSLHEIDKKEEAEREENQKKLYNHWLSTRPDSLSPSFEKLENHSTQLMQEYGELVEWIKGSNPDVRIFKNTDEMIIVGAENFSGTVSQKYYISKQDNDVIIEMKSHHPVFGEMNHKWRFWDTDSVDSIIDKINEDMYRLMMEKQQTINTSLDRVE